MHAVHHSACYSPILSYLNSGNMQTLCFPEITVWPPVVFVSADVWPGKYDACTVCLICLAVWNASTIDWWPTAQSRCKMGDTYFYRARTSLIFCYLFTVITIIIYYYTPPLIGGALSDVFVWRLSVAYIGPKSRTERPRKTKIDKEVAHFSDTTFRVKRSRSPGSFAHRHAGMSDSCSGGCGNELAVRNCCYVAVCLAMRGTSVPTWEERSGSIYRGGRPPIACFCNCHC